MNEAKGSILGTQQYWQEYFQQEIKNYESYGDEGDIWFGKSLLSKTVSWIVLNLKDINEPILEIGCGNGHLIIALAFKGYRNLTAVDYASSAIDLVQKLIQDKKSKEIKLQVADILNDSTFSNDQKFKLIIDKGTYDAICLNPDIDLDTVKLKYTEKINHLLDQNGFFLLASCNWTKDELLHSFTSHQLKCVEDIPTVQMTFGGKQGQNVTCLVFKKEELKQVDI